jgi:histidine triad (HIT) family protein
MAEREECVFCKIARKQIPAKIVEESENFIAFLDANPKADGHTLIAPKQHFVTLLDIPNRLGEEMLQFSKKIASEVLDKKAGDGFNVIMNNLGPAGQVVRHAHIHIIPRKEGDGLRSIA